MSRSVFITGTDTGVGKTLVSCALIHAFKARGLKVIGMKPVASGSEHTPQGLRNADALALQQAANVPAEYDTINPYCFAPAIAPHLAARQAGVAIELSILQLAYLQLSALADVVVAEGAGGWRVPLDPVGFLSDLPEALQLDVVLVVGMRLGCINHAVLTAEVIARGPCRLVGWVANSLEPAMPMFDENLATLRGLLPAPCLGVLPFMDRPDPVQLALHLTLPPEFLQD
jgi:dethiobiotin synthetase